jgi:hypothetical protein
MLASGTTAEDSDSDVGGRRPSCGKPVVRHRGKKSVGEDLQRVTYPTHCRACGRKTTLAHSSSYVWLCELDRCVMKSIAEIPSWLTITRVDDHHYQLTDVSVASIGCCVGVFHCREAAESIATKIAQSRAASSAERTSRNTSSQDALAMGSAAMGSALGRRSIARSTDQLRV